MIDQAGNGGTTAQREPRPESLASSRQTPAPNSRLHRGPFSVSVAGAVVPALLLLTLACGMPMTMLTVLAIIIPGMIVATVLLSISMGWIFIMIGRTRQNPRWIGGVGIMIAITMAELFTLTYISSLAPR